jgi:hypothetical protein
MTRLPFLGIEWDIGALPAPFLYVQLALLFSKGRQQYYLFPSLPREALHKCFGSGINS